MTNSADIESAAQQERLAAREQARRRRRAADLVSAIILAAVSLSAAYVVNGNLSDALAALGRMAGQLAVLVLAGFAWLSGIRKIREFFEERGQMGLSVIVSLLGPFVFLFVIVILMPLVA